jgi:hypothetical protein
MNLVALFAFAPFAAIAATGLSGCVTNANRCLPGFEYSAPYDACLDLDAGSDSGGASTVADSGGAPANQSDAAVDGGEAGAGESTADLGVTCNSASDCSGAASYCLKSPANPSAPGYCSIPNCVKGGCTSAYECCSCAAAALSELKSLPTVCVDLNDSATLVSFGCTCQ